MSGSKLYLSKIIAANFQLCYNTFGDDMSKKSIQELLKANKQYRNSVFCSYFNDKIKLLSLCNAVLNTNYTDPNELEINTLETTMLSNQKNDISCKIDNNFLVLIEHHSSLQLLKS